MYIKRILVIIAVLGLVVMGGFSYYIYNHLFTPNTQFEEDKATVFIPSDAGYQDVIRLLEPYLKSTEKFDVVARQKKYASHVRAGKYELAKGMNNNDIITVLRSRNKPVSVVFNNQHRLPDLAGRIADQIEADSLSLLKVMTDSSFLEKNGFSRETALNLFIPNKYHFYWNTSAEEFRDRMLKEYKAFWNQDRLDKAAQIGLTPNQVQSLAAIVQRETAKTEERKRVAGVYMNRLKKGMKLEADPTVIYALKNKNGQYDTTAIKRVLYKDLETDSPYNTYKNTGVPPGPIAMPDISSVDAVLDYEKHDFYFFVADPKNPGYHKFAKTLQQHNINKRAYVEWVNKLNINR